MGRVRYTQKNLELFKIIDQFNEAVTAIEDSFLLSVPNRLDKLEKASQQAEFYARKMQEQIQSMRRK